MRLFVFVFHLYAMVMLLEPYIVLRRQKKIYDSLNNFSTVYLMSMENSIREFKCIVQCSMVHGTDVLST